MIDVVYPLKLKASLYNNRELEYSLMSLRKFVKKDSIRNIYIIGDVDDSDFREKFKNDKDIFLIKHPNNKEAVAHNIISIVNRACEIRSISDRFLWMNDDFIFISPIHDIENYPYYTRGSLACGAVKLNTMNNGWHHMISETAGYLIFNCKPILNFEHHCPFIIDKNDWNKLSKVWHEDCLKHSKHGFAFRSILGNWYGYKGKEAKDCKINYKSDEKDNDQNHSYMKAESFFKDLIAKNTTGVVSLSDKVDYNIWNIIKEKISFEN